MKIVVVLECNLRERFTQKLNARDICDRKKLSAFCLKAVAGFLLFKGFFFFKFTTQELFDSYEKSFFANIC